MMEQEGDGSRRGGGEMNNQPRDRVQPQPPPPPQQPQPCPRCDSLNTKFCYYNNYSLSQPRYFCKTCRRYWTQGGTLRNVPVGGGSRKGKKAKNSSSSSSSSENSQPQQQKVVASLSPSVPSIATFYGSGGGYLASLAAFNQLNNPPSHPFGGGGGDLASSNLGLLQGFNAAASVVSQHQIRPSQFYQMGSMSLYTSEQGGLIPSSMGGNNNTIAASAAHHDWPQSFINNNASSARASDDASLWSTLSTTYIGTGGNSNRTAGAGSLVPNQWPDLQGFRPPPQ